MAEVHQPHGEPGAAAEFAGDDDAVLKRGSGGVQVTETAVGDAEAVQRTCLQVLVAEVAADGQATLQEPQTRPGFPLLVQ